MAAQTMGDRDKHDEGVAEREGLDDSEAPYSTEIGS